MKNQSIPKPIPDQNPFFIFIFRASPKFSAYLDDSFDCPLNATTVRIASKTSSAIEPAFAYASNSFFDNCDVICKKKKLF